MSPRRAETGRVGLALGRAALLVATCLVATCVHGTVDVPRVCKSADLRFNPAPSVVNLLIRAQAASEALAESVQTVSQTATLDVRPIFRDFDAEVTPLELTLTAISGIRDFHGLEHLVISLGPIVDDPARPPITIADELPTAEQRTLSTLTTPLTLTSDQLRRYGADDELRVAVELTGLLPTSAFDVAYSACFRARGTF